MLRSGKRRNSSRLDRFNLPNKVYANIAICSVAPLSHSHKCSREIIEYECLELSFAISKTIKKWRYSYYGDPMRTSFEMGRKKRTPISLTNAVLYLKLR